MPTDNLKKGFALLFTSKMFLGFMSFFLSVFLSEIGYNGFEIGFLMSLYAITALFTLFPSGVLNDRYDIRYVLWIGFFLLSVFSLCLAYVSNIFLLIALFITGGVGDNLVRNSLRNLVYKEETPGKDGNKYGVFYLFNSGGVFAGIILGVVIAYAFSFADTLMFIGVFFLALFFAVFTLKPTKIEKIKLSGYKKDFLTTGNILFAFILFMNSTHWGAEHVAYALFIKTAFHLDILYSGLFIAFPTLVLALTAYKIGKGIDKKTDFKKMFLLSLFISGTFHILMVNPNVYLSFIFRIMHKVCDGMMMTIMMFWISKRFESVRIGGNAGLMNLVMIMGQFFGSLIYGPIGDMYGYGIPLIASGAVSITSAFIFYEIKDKL